MRGLSQDMKLALGSAEMVLSEGGRVVVSTADDRD